MSSAASPNSTGPSISSQSVESSSAKGLRTPPARPQLMGPPVRPKRPVAPAPKAPEPTPEPVAPEVIGPISAPSERMQYRAIGMLKGKYQASEEQFNRGNIEVADGTLVDAVLLGRVTSLIKKHIDLETEHVWVVYPRTLYAEDDGPSLHVQIVGVWEPETLNNRNSDDQSAEEDAEGNDSEPRYLTTQEATAQCDHFSIRGEVAKYDEEKEEITINIVQKSKSETAKAKRPFKLLIIGKLVGRTVGHFWDLEVKREAENLVLQTAKAIAVVPPKRKSNSPRKAKRRGPMRSHGGSSKPVPKPKPVEKKADISKEDDIQRGDTWRDSAQKDAQNGSAVDTAYANGQSSQHLVADTAPGIAPMAQAAERAEIVALSDDPDGARLTDNSTDSSIENAAPSAETAD